MKKKEAFYASKEDVNCIPDKPCGDRVGGGALSSFYLNKYNHTTFFSKYSRMFKKGFRFFCSYSFIIHTCTFEIKDKILPYVH